MTMRLYRFLLVMCGLLLMVNFAEADGDDVLKRVIQLPKMKGTVYTLLGKVSEQSGCLFVYDSKLINNDASAKTKGKAYSLREMIYEIVGNDKLTLKVIGKHILILPPGGGGKSPIEALPISSQPVYHSISGRLLDRETGNPVVNATVAVRGTSIGNVSNQDGAFKLSLPDSLKESQVAFSHLGYVLQEIPASALMGRDNVLSLDPKVIPLQEVLIRLVEPNRLLHEMMEERERNYSMNPVYLTTFYREGVQLKNKFQSLTEAVFKVYKAPVNEPYALDQVKLLKKHRIDNRENTDSLIAKIRAGIQACLQLDLMKNLPDFFALDAPDNPYVYTSGDVTFIDNRCVNVIYFRQREGVKGPLYCGELYIDSEKDALVQARFEVQPKYIKQATRLFVVRQAQKMRLSTRKIVYTVSYKLWNGKYYIHHIRGDLYFKIKRKNWLSSNPQLHTWFEMVTCHIDTEHVNRFSRAERLPTHTVFAETHFKYDESFWEDFNFIPLESELGKVMEKVALKIEKVGDETQDN